MFTRSGDQIEIATFRALRRAKSSFTDTKLIFLNTSHSMDRRASSAAFGDTMVERNALLISFRGEKVRSPLQLHIIIHKYNRLPHLGTFVRGPAFWQSATTCRVPLRPSYRCSTLAVHLRPVACMQIASSHPATGVTSSRVQ